MQIVEYIQNSALESEPFNFALVLFSYGCNLSCSFCKGYNFEKVTDPLNVVGNVIDIIDTKITPLDDTVVFLGGEPTIHGGDLIEALKHCKSKGLNTKIFTNGINTDVIKHINNLNLCDAWSVDYKCLSENSTNLLGFSGNYEQIIESTVKNILNYNIHLEIRTTICLANKHQIDYIKDTVTQLTKDTQVKHIMQEDFRLNLNKGNYINGD